MATLSLTPNTPGNLLLTSPYPLSALSIYNVKDYGAKGDNATNNTAAFQAAITDAVAAGGGTIYIPAGTYLLDKAGSYDFGALGLGVHTYAVSLAANNVPLRFVGAGPGITVLKKTTASVTADYTLFLTPAVSAWTMPHLSFENLTLDGAQTSVNAPFTSGTEHLLFSYSIQRFIARNCNFQYNRGGGLYLFGTIDSNIDGNLFTLLNRNTTDNSITIHSSLQGGEPFLGALAITNNHFVDNDQVDIGVGGYAGGTIYRQVAIAGNNINHKNVTNGMGMELQSVNSLGPITVIGNTFDGGQGAFIQGDGMVISGNSFRNMNRPLAGYGCGLKFNNSLYANNVSVVGNIFKTGTDMAIDVQGTDILVANNQITGFATGVNILAGATRAKVCDNNIQNCTTPIADAGTASVIEDNLGDPRRACRVYHNAAQSIATSTETTLAFNSERFDPAALHDPVTNNSRITVDRAGFYEITATVSFASNSAGYRQLLLYLNGTTVIDEDSRPAVNGDITTLSVKTIYQLAAGDFLQLHVWQTSGGALNVNSSANFSPEFSVTFLYPTT